MVTSRVSPAALRRVSRIFGKLAVEIAADAPSKRAARVASLSRFAYASIVCELPAERAHVLSYLKSINGRLNLTHGSEMDRCISPRAEDPHSFVVLVRWYRRGIGQNVQGLGKTENPFRLLGKSLRHEGNGGV